MSQFDELQAARDLLQKTSATDPTLQRGGVTESGQFFTKIVNVPGGDTVKSISGFVNQQVRNSAARNGGIFAGLIVGGIFLLLVGYVIGRQYAIPIASIQPVVQSANVARQPEPAKVEVKVADQPPVVAEAKPTPEKRVRVAAASVEYDQTQPKTAKPGNTKTSFPDTFLPNWSDASISIADSFMTITCNKDAQVFVDGVFKGKIATGAMTVALKPGKHKLTMTHAKFGFYTQEIDIATAKTEHMHPKECD